MWTTDKSDFLNCLTEIAEPSYSAPEDVGMVVIDGPAFVHMNQPRQSKTFGDYCKIELGENLKKIADRVEELDLVFDVYTSDSLKTETRENRGKGVRASVKESTSIYSDFKNFLRHDDNKTELFQLIAQSIPDFLSHVSTKVICTKLKTVTSNSDDNLDSLHPCNHEEADNTIFVYLNRALSMGLKRVLIKCNDADVVVIAIAQYQDLGIDELWVEFGVGRKKRWLTIHTYAKHLGRLKCLALLFWYAFTGCDTVSSFNSRGKKTA